MPVFFPHGNSSVFCVKVLFKLSMLDFLMCAESMAGWQHNLVIHF